MSRLSFSLRHSFWKKTPVLRLVCRRSRFSPRYSSCREFFDARGEFRGKEQQFFERVGVLRSRHECSVARGPVGVGIPSGAEVAVAVYALGRGIDTRPVTAVRTEIVELHASAVDFVVELLGYVGHVGRTVQCVSSAAELVDMVVFGRQTHVGR